MTFTTRLNAFILQSAARKKQSAENGVSLIMNRDELLKLLEEINEPEYRRAFVEGHAKDTIAFQIRQLKKCSRLGTARSG